MKFHVIVNQAVWERTAFVIEADTAEEAEEKFQDGGYEEIAWSEITDSVEGLSSEIEDVRTV